MATKYASGNGNWTGAIWSNSPSGSSPAAYTFQDGDIANLNGHTVGGLGLNGTSPNGLTIVNGNLSNVSYNPGPAGVIILSTGCVATATSPATFGALQVINGATLSVTYQIEISGYITVGAGSTMTVTGYKLLLLGGGILNVSGTLSITGSGGKLFGNNVCAVNVTGGGHIALTSGATLNQNGMVITVDAASSITFDNTSTWTFPTNGGSYNYNFGSFLPAATATPTPDVTVAPVSSPVFTLPYLITRTSAQGYCAIIGSLA